ARAEGGARAPGAPPLDTPLVMHAIRHSDHVHVTLLSRERLHGDIWRWILSLSYYLLLLVA
ncbi:MAG: hypothetical protein MJE68_26830, partial [Proteobacteria bacterium]|nr:hypothetical protein [Pseudomonadota bacterium]